jgi:SHS2 domain-containing protein
MPEYEFLEHTADLKFRARGKSLTAVLENVAKALTYSIVGDIQGDVEVERRFEFTSNNLNELVHDWLSELLYEIQYNSFIPTKYTINLKESGEGMAAVVGGIAFKQGIHEIKHEVKAVTYHEMKVEATGSGWIVEVVCDT